MKERITAEKIAKLAKVSPSTVSRALNPDQSWRISRAKREEIRLLSGQYGLRSRSARKAGAFLKTFRVALLLGSMERDLSQGQNLMIRHLCDRLQASGYILELIRVDFSPQKLVASVKNILRSKEADVYVIGGGLLKGQSLEFLHKISSRLILRLNAQSVHNPYPEFHWLSYLRADRRNGRRQRVGRSLDVCEIHRPRLRARIDQRKRHLDRHARADEEVTARLQSAFDRRFPPEACVFSAAPAEGLILRRRHGILLENISTGERRCSMFR
jgi:hypothetical protein